MKTEKKEPSEWPSVIQERIKKSSKSCRKRKINYNADRFKKLGYTVDIQKKVFETKHTRLLDMPVPDRYYARMLIRLGFKQQLQLFS